MLSILVPIHNYYCTELIESLYASSIRERISFEIIILDDASEEKYRTVHRSLDRLDRVRYVENDTNLGRSASRNKLARMSSYEYLLYLDCDSKLTTGSFIRNYVDQIEDKTVLYGGRLYQSTRPVQPDKWMHWRYGKKREARSLSARRAFPYQWFHSNNFLIARKTMREIGFDESLSQYGYEDSLFAEKLRKASIGIKHIDNPVIHLGLLDNEEFLRKTHLALDNLYRMIQNDEQMPVRLVRSYKMAKRLGLGRYIVKKYRQQAPYWERQILSGEAKLSTYDWYRIGYLLAKDYEHRE